MAMHAVLVILLASLLPPDAWFVGDPGVKLIAARSAIAHPSRPLETELPPVPPAMASDYPQPFFVPHGDHAHAFTSQLFPLLSAPFIALFGLRGAYVLPAIGWILIGPLTARLAATLRVRAPAGLVMALSIAATPFAFYGLEFWEHTPAIASLLGAAVLVTGRPQSALGMVAAGALAGVAVLLRPETIWSCAALAIALAMTGGPRRLPAFGGGVVLAMLPIGAYNLAHFGAVAGPHVSGNIAMLSEGWLRERVSLAGLWLGAHRLPNWIALGLVGSGWVLPRQGVMGKAAQLAAGVGIGWLALSAARGHDVRETWFRVFPAGLFALLPAVASSSGRRSLWMLVLVPIAGVLLTAPNDGGGQWGPRYLMAASPMLLLLAVDSCLDAVRRMRGLAVVAAFVLVAGISTTMAGVRELRESKQTYARMVHATAAQLGPASYVVTDVWWFGQVHAAVIDPARVLHVERPEQAAARLSEYAPRDVLLVRAGGQTSEPADAWVKGTCYTARRTDRSEAGELAYVHLTCGGG